MKLLVFLPRIPYPLNKGDKLRAYHQIKHLSENNDIYLFCLSSDRINPSHVDELKPYCKDIHICKLSWAGIILTLIKNIFSCIPLQVSLFTTYKAEKKFVSYFKKINPDAVYFQFVRSAEYAKKIKTYIQKHADNTENKKIKTVLDFQDCLSMNMYRRAMVSGFAVKQILMLETVRLRKYENSMFDLFDTCTIITKQDRDCIVSIRRKEIKIIENGVDEKFFNFTANADKRYDIIFSGNMSYKPNIVAAEFLVKKILPLVQKSIPGVKVVLAGSNPVKQVTDLACSNVEVTGWVEDMRLYYARSRVFAAPMQIGTGLQNKLLEAMAMSLPCVATPLACNALKHPEQSGVLTSQSEDGLAKHIVALLNGEDLRTKAAQTSSVYVKTNYNWALSVKKLEQLLK
ncbi:MAG: glycosyltransferase [Bacteroidales bacterium]|nr:glycosyltransferase [Bacteroidales bacterium]